MYLFNDMHLRSPRNDGDIFSGAQNVGLADFTFKVIVGNFLDRRSVQGFRLQHDARIGIVNACQQQTLRLIGASRHDHIQTGNMGKEGLGTLRVVQRTVTDGTAGRPEG